MQMNRSQSISTEKLMRALFEISFISALFISLFLLLNTTMLFEVTSALSYVNAYLIVCHVALSSGFILLFIRFYSEYQNGQLVSGSYCIFGMKIAIGVALWLFWVMRGSETNEAGIFVMVILAMSLGHQKSSQLLKCFLLLESIVVVLFFFLSMIGIVANNRGNSFGFIYYTDYACHLLCLALLLCLIRNGFLSCWEELGLFALFMVDGTIIGGKTAFLCLFLLCYGTYLRHYREVRGVPFQDKQEYVTVIRWLFQILYFPIRVCMFIARRLFHWPNMSKGSLWNVLSYSFLFAAGLMILLTLSYRLIPETVWGLFSRLRNVISRFLLGTIGFEHYSIRLFGNSIPQIGSGGTESQPSFYFFLDSSYVKALLEYGLIVFVIFLGMMTLAQRRLYRKGYRYGVFLLSLFALDCMMEHHLTDFSYNVFILLAFCEIDFPSFRPVSPVSLFFRKRRKSSGHKKSRWIVSTVLAVFGVLWIVSAYRISTWSGWSPSGSSTVIIPGSYMDSIHSDKLTEARLENAVLYLKLHKGSVCIVSGKEDSNNESETEQMGKWLLDQGIAPSSVYYDNSSDSIDEMLTNADEMIREMDLPRRKTVCTFAMQQARVEKHAKKLHTPVNSLEAKMPWYLYLPCYLVEQCKILL